MVRGDFGGNGEIGCYGWVVRRKWCSGGRFDADLYPLA